LSRCRNPAEVQKSLDRRLAVRREYFCVLEALQNVAKYSKASHALVRLSETGGHLRFRVEDDGAGFDTRETSFGTGLQGWPIV
jgi:nitrate/nitrite-specific signal transduction histidine kinase